jgi:crotonobetainyl-CoA:carnitine CoA-transferase CaiB-like acyl-CoA transferase
MTPERPYAGLRVLDLGQGIAAPYCAMLLAMQAAEVVKLEPPGGDWSRGLGTRYGDHTAMSVQYNRGKKSLALDLKSAAGREVALELALRADILVEGFRPGVAARFGLGWEALSTRNKRLVYVSVSGFGQDGPYADLPCTDSVAQAFSGLVAVNIGNDGTPHRVGALIVDALTGLYAAQAVGVALYARERHGAGRRLEFSLAQSAAAILGHRLAEHVLEGGNPRALNVPTGAYRTGDGGWVMVALIREEDFVRLAGALGRPELADDPRFATPADRRAHRAELDAELEAWVSTFSSAADVEKALGWSTVLVAEVRSVPELADTEWAEERGAFTSVDLHTGTRVRIPQSPWRFHAADTGAQPVVGYQGQHNREVLAELAGVTDAEVDDLTSAAVLRERRPRQK